MTGLIKLTSAAIAVAGLALAAPATASATVDGIWVRSGSWPTNEQCQPIKDEIYVGGNLTNPPLGQPCSHDSTGYYFKIYNEF